MEFFYVLLILLVITRTFGELAVRLEQPALVGELLSGIVLGAVIKLSPPSFPIMNSLTDNEVFTAITDLGIFFLMLMAGLDMHPKEIRLSAGANPVYRYRPGDHRGARGRQGFDGSG